MLNLDQKIGSQIANEKERNNKNAKGRPNFR